jgi:hypothetical protein
MEGSSGRTTGKHQVQSGEQALGDGPLLESTLRLAAKLCLRPRAVPPDQGYALDVDAAIWGLLRLHLMKIAPVGS